MKELIKEETLDIVRQMITDGQVSQEVAEKYFPELKESEESEDERVKKAIKYGLDYVFTNNTTVYETTKEQCLAWLEKRGEQNKVEPKFKHGDWIVTNKNHIWYVDETPETTSYLYRLINQYGKVAVAVFEAVDNVARLWTIQDAKAGDVLYLQKDGKEHIIIYKGVTKERFTTFVSAYCAYNGIVDAFCFADVSRYVDIAYGGIMPATKEQRDTLMKAMADDGYGWDAEKRELKKIEQSPLDVRTTGYWHVENAEQNPAWSKEDIRKIKLICTYLDAYKAYQTPVGAEYIDGCISWAKALISRVGCEADCTTTWKPSIEQMDALYTYIYNPQYFNSPDPRMELVESVYKELKKLREE